MFSEFYDDDTMKAIKVGDAFDLAYICVILAAIGKAIPNIEKEEDAIYFLKGEGYATSMETMNAPGEAETRAAKWKQQRVMTIVISFAIGLKKMKAELIRRVDAWKEFARIKETVPFPVNCSDGKILVALTQHGIPQPTSASPDWGTVRPDWRTARAMFHIECSSPTITTDTIKRTQANCVSPSAIDRRIQSDGA